METVKNHILESKSEAVIFHRKRILTLAEIAFFVAIVSRLLPEQREAVNLIGGVVSVEMLRQLFLAHKEEKQLSSLK